MKRLAKLLCVMLAALPVQGMSNSVNERDIKAALIYNFALFTSWPESKSERFTICVFDEDRDNINRAILQSKTIDAKPVDVAVIHNQSALRRCQVLYLEDSSYAHDQSLEQNVENLSLLSIVDVTNHGSVFGIVNIQMENKKYNFSINNEAAKRANLTLSSKLLRLATKVY